MSTFRSVVRPKKIKVTTDFAGTLDFTGRATAFEITSGQSLAFTTTTNTEHLIDGQIVEIYNEGVTDVIIGAALTLDNISIDIEPDTAAILIWTSAGVFKDMGGTAAIKNVQEAFDAHVVNYDAHKHNGTDAPKVLATDLDITGSSNLEVLRVIGGVPTWDNLFIDQQPDSISIIPSDTTTNLNQAVATTIPMSGTIDVASTTAGLAVSGEGLQVNHTGKVRVSFNVATTGSITRGNLRVRVAVNGTPVPGVSSSGYIRNTGGHNESSYSFSKLINVTSGQVVTLQSEQEGASGTITMVANGSFLEVEIPASTMAVGPAGLDGAAGWEWRFGSTVPLSGLGDDGDVYLRTTTGDLYQKITGTWTILMNITGAQGPSGDLKDMLWAEETSALSDNNTQWSFGNGATGNIAVVINQPGTLTGMSLSSSTAGTSSTVVEILVNGLGISRSITLAANVAHGFINFGTPYSVVAGDRIGFRTVLGGGASNSRVKADLVLV
jgi:hypothetical protein